jgi:hypothetical protein
MTTFSLLKPKTWRECFTGGTLVVCDGCGARFPYNSAGRFGSFDSDSFLELWNHGVKCEKAGEKR